MSERLRPILLTLAAIVMAWLAWSSGDAVAGILGLGELALLVRLGLVFVALSLLEAIYNRIA